MRVSDSQHFRKTVAGVCMICGPLVLLIAFAVSPKLETAASRQLAAAAGHPDRYLFTMFGALLGVTLLFGAILGLMHMMRERQPGYSNIGGGIALLGALGVMASLSVGFMVWVMAKDTVTAAERSLLHDYNQSAGAMTIGVVGYFLAVGLVVMAMGLYRARYVDWWMAMCIALGAVLIEVAFPAHALWLAIVGSAFLLVGLGSVGLMVLRETDADWEHTPEYRGFRPVTGTS